MSTPSLVFRSLRLQGARLGAIDGGLLALSGHVVFAGVMFGPVYLDWIAAFGTSPASSIASLWTLAAPAAGMAAGGPLFSWLERDFGVLRMLRLSCALVFLSGSMGMMADTVWYLLMARVLVGMAAAAMLVSTTAIFRMRYPGGVWRDWRRRQDLLAAFSAVVGLVLVGVLSQYGWKVPFLLHIVGLPAYALVWWISTRLGLRALVRRHTLLERERQGVRPSSSVSRVEHQEQRNARPLQWMLILTMFVSMLHFFGLVQVVSAVVVTEFGQHAMSVAFALSGLAIGTALAMWKSTRVAKRYGEAITVSGLFAICAGGLWMMSGVQTIYGLAAVLMLIGLGFGGLRPVLVAWFDRISHREQGSWRLSVALPAYYLGVVFSPLFVLYVQDWRQFQKVSATWLLVIAAVYAGAGVRVVYGRNVSE